MHKYNVSEITKKDDYEVLVANEYGTESSYTSDLDGNDCEAMINMEFRTSIKLCSRRFPTELSSAAVSSLQKKGKVNKKITNLSQLQKNCEFNAFITDIGADSLGAMITIQYRSYCFEHGVNAKLKSGRKYISGLGSSYTLIGVAIIPIPFPKLGIIKDIKNNMFAEDKHYYCDLVI